MNLIAEPFLEFREEPIGIVDVCVAHECNWGVAHAKGNCRPAEWKVQTDGRLQVSAAGRLELPSVRATYDRLETMRQATAISSRGRPSDCTDSPLLALHLRSAASNRIRG